MAEIDLIPSSYRYWMWQRKLLKHSGVGLAVLLSIALIAFAVLHWQTGSTLDRLQLLQSESRVSQQQQQRLQYLTTEKSSLERQWSVLSSLRGGTTVETLNVAIDSALDSSDVWFDSWRFKRRGSQITEQELEERRRIGAHIIEIAQASIAGRVGAKTLWSIETELALTGGAADHSALSAFVEDMLDEPRISDVKVLNTNINRSNEQQSSIQFELEVAVNNVPDA